MFILIGICILWSYSSLMLLDFYDRVSNIEQTLFLQPLKKKPSINENCFPYSRYNVSLTPMGYCNYISNKVYAIDY